jgi:hypothetical protein
MTDQWQMPTPEQIDELTDEIRLALRGKGPLMQGAALADIVAMFFAGHAPAIREEVITQWNDVVRKLIPVNEGFLFEQYGKPEGWDVS